MQLLSKEQTDIVKNAIDVLKNFYDPFSKKNFEAILKNCEISESQLKAVYHEVGKLNPNPGGSFSNSAEITNYILPDFSVSYYDGKLILKLNKSNNRQVFVNKAYKKILEETKDKETKSFIIQRIELAQWFVDAIKQRENTLQNVMSAILEFQHDYFVSGDEIDLKPMILMDIAEIVQMDISTISRVSNSKYVETFFGTFLGHFLNIFGTKMPFFEGIGVAKLCAVDSEGIVQTYPNNDPDSYIMFILGDLPDYYTNYFENDIDGWFIGDE